MRLYSSMSHSESVTRRTLSVGTQVVRLSLLSACQRTWIWVEFQAAAATQSEVRGKFVARYRADTDATHAILHRGKRYQLLGVLPDNESGLEWMTLPYAEGVAVAP